MDGEYEELETVAEDDSFVLRRARITRTGAPLLVKSALPSADQSAATLALRRECELALQLPGAAQLLPRMAPHGQSVALVMQDPGGVGLGTALAKGPLPVGLALAVTVQLAAGITELHKLGFVHGAIRPGAVLCDPKRALAWWVDVGSAYRPAGGAAPVERGAAVLPRLSKERLVYAAPECTGRVDSSVDSRSDLYSLGVLLYQMLTGAPPFQSDDVLELIHLHVAGQAAAPAQRNAGIPPVLSELVMKLLAKAPDERYQSGHGLLHDLQRCAQRWASEPDRGADTRERIEPFELGRHDVPRGLSIGTRLIGRDAEVRQLLEAFDAACAPHRDAPATLVLVQGYAGVGKTALIEQLYKPIVRRRGRFISGKFDQLARGVPFGALIQAFTAFVHQALGESEAQLAQWRSRLTLALAGNGGVLVDVIPELELIVGPQGAPVALPAEQARNRFERVLHAFVGALASPQYPLVLFLDDLQWADAATLGLLEPLLTSGEIRGLMLLGAYRDNELDAAPGLAQCLEDLGRAGVRVQRLPLAPLGPLELTQLVADALHCADGDSAHAQPLAATLFAQTRGNPLFATQFLKSLERDGHFHYDADAGHWAYRLESISSAPLADSVVDLMTRRISRLPARAQYALTLAACIGNRFDLHTLALVSEQSADATAEDLELALAEGLVVRMGAALAWGGPDGTGFGFVHDRVQQSAYALIPAPRRAHVHLSLGRTLWARARAQPDAAEWFDVVHHLNLGRELIQERDERLQVAALNLSVGQRAQAATARQSALGLFEGGLALLDEQAWSDAADLSFELHFESAQSLYLCGDFEAAERRLAELGARARTPFERARIARQRSVQLENQGHYAQALATMREGLAQFDVTFPESEADQAAALEREIARIDELRGSRAIAELVDLPAMTDPQVRMVMGMLTVVWSAAFLVGQATLARLFSATLVRLSLRHGNVEESAYGYVTHAITVGPVRGDYATAFEFGLLALAVNQRLDDRRLRAKIYQQFHAHVNLWCRPFRTCIGYARQAHASGLDAGDHLYAAYALGTEPWSAFVAMPSLAQFVHDYAPQVAVIEQLKNRGFADSLRIFLNWARALQGLTEAPLSLSDASLDEAAYGREYGGNPFFGAIHSILRLQLTCLLGTPEQAIAAAEIARGRVHNVPGTIWPVVERLWNALALAGQCEAGALDAAQRALPQMREALAWFESMVPHCEANFHCPALLLAGVVARVEGREREALAQLEAAIEAAVRLGHPRLQGLAHEWCVRVHLGLGQAHNASMHLGAALRCYAHWGAAAKVKALRQQYPALLETESDAPVQRAVPQESSVMSTSALPSSAEAMDLSSVLKVAQAIASEVNFDSLLASLLHLTIENAAAEYGHLVLEDDGAALVYSASAAPDPAATAPRGVPLEQCDAVPHSIVNYVRRSGQMLVLAAEQILERFGTDPHVARHAPRSVLCVPVRRHGALVGVLYLEHRRIGSVFTARRVRVLELLAAQAAIALENARLFTSMHQQIGERELAQAELAAALAEVQRLKDDLEAENTYLRRDLVANVSHDLRTPLVAMRGYLEVLAAKGSALSEEQRRSYLDIAVRQCAHLATLIDELFELAKLDFKGVKINREAIQFADLVSDVLQKFKLAADGLGIGLRVDAGRGLPLVSADVSLMERVLDNLIGNALAHTPAGGHVEVGLERHDPGVLVKVRDTGEGIAPEQLPMIFNRFYRVDKARTSVGGSTGAGLGLAIAKRIVELHGGSIAVQSQPLQGTCFSFGLPAHQASPSA
jgi:predicted ATPase/signal transduction histidine kinase